MNIVCGENRTPSSSETGRALRNYERMEAGTTKHNESTNCGRDCTYMLLLLLLQMRDLRIEQEKKKRL